MNKSSTSKDSNIILTGPCACKTVVDMGLGFPQFTVSALPAGFTGDSTIDFVDVVRAERNGWAYNQGVRLAKHELVSINGTPLSKIPIKELVVLLNKTCVAGMKMEFGLKASYLKSLRSGNALKSRKSTRFFTPMGTGESQEKIQAHIANRRHAKLCRGL